jgi:uncharacterized protein DUF4239
MLSNIASIAVIIVLSSIGPVIGLLVFRKIYPAEKFRELHDVAGSILNIIGTMYALLVALIVVDARSRMEDVRNKIEQEANALADIFWMADVLPSQEKMAIQKTAYDYARAIVESEWPSMAQGKGSQEAWQKYAELWNKIEAISPTTQQEQIYSNAILNEMSHLGDSRRIRVVSSQRGVSTLLWFVLLAGAFVTIAFTYFFGAKKLRAQAIMTALLTVIIALNLLLVFEYSGVYSGTLRIDPNAFKFESNKFSERLGLTPPYPSLLQ